MADMPQKSNEPVDVQSLVCSKCKKVFGYLSRAAYLQHVKGCGHQRFPCGICGHLFLTASTLRTHLKKHVIQFKCKICQRSFNSKYQLRTHQKSHVDISQRIKDRVKCNLCNKTFQWKSSLRHHEDTHGLHGPYPCECGKIFKTYSQFYKHAPQCSSFLQDLAKKQQNTTDDDSEKNEHVTESVIDEEKVTTSVSHTCQICSANFSDREHFEQHAQNCDILFPPKYLGRQQVLKLNHDKAKSVNIWRLLENAKDKVLGSKSHSRRTSSVTTSFSKPKSVNTKKKKTEDAHVKEAVKLCIESTGCLSEINEIKIKQDVITEVNLDTVVEVKVEQFSDGEPANIDINAQSVNVNYDMGEDCNVNYDVGEDCIEVKNEVQECQNDRRSSRKRKKKRYIGYSTDGYSTDGMERKDSGDDSDEEDIYVQSVDVNEEQNTDVKQSETQTYVIRETSTDSNVWLDLAVRCTTGDCGEVVLGVKNIEKHKLNKHEEQLRYKCSACDNSRSNKGFLKRRYLKDHFLTIHSNLNCVKLSFKNAEITDSTPDIYHCTKCLFMTQDQPFPIDHNCRRVSLKYFCPYCVKNTFESYAKCESHLKSEHADKVDYANKNKYIRLRTTMYDPALSVQEGETECVTCKTICNDTEQLKIHVNDKHASHPYCCGLCRTVYGRQVTLDKHLKSHNPPLPRTQCNKRFLLKPDLQRHMARHDDIPDEDAPVEETTVKDNATQTEMGLINPYFEEVIEETYPTENTENVAGASNLMLFAGQLTSLASGDAVGCKDPVEPGNYMANTNVSDGKKLLSNLNLRNSSQNSAYHVATLTVPEKMNETEYVIDNSEALAVEGNATDVTQLLTQTLDIHNYSALQREESLLNPIQEEVLSEKSHKKHVTRKLLDSLGNEFCLIKYVTRKLVDSLGNEVCLINGQGMPINVNNLGDTDALDLGFGIVEVTGDENEDKGSTRAWQRQLSEGVKGDGSSLNDTGCKFVVLEDDIHERIQKLPGHKPPQMKRDQQGIGEVKHDDKNDPQKEAIKMWDTISPALQVYDENSVILTDEKNGVANVGKLWDSSPSDVQEYYINPETSVHEVETVNYKPYLNHYENRTKELFPYKCEVCGKLFKCVKYMTNHKKIHLPCSQRQCICQVCGLGFTSWASLRIHNRIHTNERPYSCSICDKTFRQRGHLKSHLRLHDGYTPFRCSYCSKKYTTNSQLRKHVLKHHKGGETGNGRFNNEQVTCSSCGETFLHSGALTIHKLEHLSSRAQLELLSQFSIEEVKPSSQNNSSTEKAKQSAQKRIAKQKTNKSRDTFSTVCDICGDVFQTKDGFRLHSRRHKVEAGEMYQCQHCPKSIWQTQEELDEHAAITHRELIQCDQCGLQVESYSKLRQHKKKEHVDQEIKCSRCQRVFVSASGFVTHVKKCFGHQFLSKLQEATK